MDDENEAVTENVPVSGEVVLPTKQKWRWDEIGYRKMHNFTN